MWKRIQAFFREQGDRYSALGPPEALEEDDIGVGVVEACESPFGVPVLDMSAYSESYMAFTGSQKVAEIFLEMTREKGMVFSGVPPEGEGLARTQLEFKIENPLWPGVLFLPDEMENKWAI